MSYDKKRFCFYCKLDSDQLEKLNKSLKTCGICKIAQYCGKECQKLDFLPGTYKTISCTNVFTKKYCFYFLKGNISSFLSHFFAGQF